MDYSKLFYWLTVADNAKNFFIVFIAIFSAISLIATICYIFNGESGEERSQKMSRQWMWWSYPFMILFWTLYIFTPSKKDALLIVAGGQTLNYLTTDSTARQIPKELSNFIVTELKNMASEAKVNIESNDQKKKILESAKSMSAEELIKTLKVDSNFKQVILEN